MKTIKVGDETHRKLLKICGSIQATSDEKITMEKAIKKLMGVWEEKA